MQNFFFLIFEFLGEKKKPASMQAHVEGFQVLGKSHILITTQKSPQKNLGQKKLNHKKKHKFLCFLTLNKKNFKNISDLSGM